MAGVHLTVQLLTGTPKGIGASNTIRHLVSARAVFIYLFAEKWKKLSAHGVQVRVRT